MTKKRLLLALLSLVACNHSDSTGLSVGAKLETFDYDALGHGKILVEGNALYIVDADARTARVVQDYSYNPALSPDGTRFVQGELFPFGGFGSSVSGSAYTLVTLDGLTRTNVASLPWLYGNRPSWTPDGSTVVFATGLGFGENGRGAFVPPAVYRAPTVSGPASGAQLWRSFSLAPDGSFPCPTVEFAEIVTVNAATDMAFVCHSAIWVVASNGQGRELYVSPSGSGPHVPTWSPDGNSVAFMETESTSSPEGMRIKLVNAITGETSTLASMPTYPATQSAPPLAISLCWLAPAGKIVFTAPLDGATWRMYAVPVTGGQPVRVSSGEQDSSVSCSR